MVTSATAMLGKRKHSCKVCIQKMKLNEADATCIGNDPTEVGGESRCNDGLNVGVTRTIHRLRDAYRKRK